MHGCAVRRNRRGSNVRGLLSKGSSRPPPQGPPARVRHAISQRLYQSMALPEDTAKPFT